MMEVVESGTGSIIRLTSLGRSESSKRLLVQEGRVSTSSRNRSHQHHEHRGDDHEVVADTSSSKRHSWNGTVQQSSRVAPEKVASTKQERMVEKVIQKREKMLRRQLSQNFNGGKSGIRRKGPSTQEKKRVDHEFLYRLGDYFDRESFEAPEFQPPLSRKEMEAKKQEFIESLEIYQDLKAIRQEEEDCPSDERIFLSDHTFDVTKTYNSNESVLKEKYKIKKLGRCPYCLGANENRKSTWCPFHLKNNTNKFKLPEYPPLKTVQLINEDDYDYKKRTKFRGKSWNKEIFGKDNHVEMADPKNEEEFFMSLDQFRELNS